MTAIDQSGGILTIDLAALAANYRSLAARVAPAALAAVVKANAYGLGMEKIAPALAEAGCTAFFVATAEEGIDLRMLLPRAEIHVFDGVIAGSENHIALHRLIPVLNSLDDIARWRRYSATHAVGYAADLHVDTGMARLGLDAEALAALAADPALLDGIQVDCIVSHLACAEEPENAMNAKQLALFNERRAALPGRRASLAASSGSFLGPEFHFDLVRSGIALYGANPTPADPNPMAQVVRLQGRILQVRVVDTLETVGYGATRSITRPTKIATVAVGYADGYLRSASGTATAYVGDTAAPVVGRVSMDLTTVDVTDAPPDQIRIGALVDLIGPHNPVDDLAAAAGTIGYEVLTRLGPRLHRHYLPSEGRAA